MSVNNLYPTARPSLDLNFSGSRTVDPRITFSRAGTGNIASYFNEKGVMQFAPANTPRIDFDPATLECKGLLIEEQRTNLLTYSEQFDNAVFLKTASSITQNAIISPDGNLTADKLIEDTTTGEHFLRSTPVSCSAGTYTASVYWHSSSERSLYFRVVHTGDISNTSQVLFNRSFLALESVSGNAISASAQNVGGGWWRISLVFQITATRNVQFGVQCFYNSASYTGDGVSGIYIWGAQLEQGSFPTSYIPNTSSQVTRAADSVSMQSSNFSSWYKQKTGTIVAAFTSFATSPSSSILFTISDNTFNNCMLYQTSLSGSLNASAVFVKESGSNVASLGASINIAYESKSYKKTAFSFSDNNINAVGNGGTISQDNDGVVPTVDRLYIGSNWTGSGNFLNGTISRLMYYPYQVTSQQLQTLTT